MVARSATPSDVRVGSFWTERGSLIVAALLLAFAQDPQRYDLSNVIRCATTEDVEAPVEILRALGVGLADQLADALESLAGSQAREYRGGVFATVQSALSVYLDPAVLEASRAPGRFRPSMLRDGTVSRLYIVGSLHDQRRLTPLVLAFLDEVEDWSAVAAAQSSPGRSHTPASRTAGAGVTPASPPVAAPARQTRGCQPTAPGSACWFGAHIEIPRVAADQYGAATPVTAGSEQPGDLIFSEFGLHGPGHVQVVVTAGNPGTAAEEPHTGDVSKTISYSESGVRFGRPA